MSDGGEIMCDLLDLLPYSLELGGQLSRAVLKFAAEGYEVGA